MQRIKAVNPITATGKTKALLSGIKKSYGTISNMMRTMANSPDVLEGFLKFWCRRPDLPDS